MVVVPRWRDRIWIRAAFELLGRGIEVGAGDLDQPVAVEVGEFHARRTDRQHLEWLVAAIWPRHVRMGHEARMAPGPRGDHEMVHAPVAVQVQGVVLERGRDGRAGGHVHRFAVGRIRQRGPVAGEDRGRHRQEALRRLPTAQALLQVHRGQHGRQPRLRGLARVAERRGWQARCRAHVAAGPDVVAELLHRRQQGPPGHRAPRVLHRVAAGDRARPAHLDGLEPLAGRAPRARAERERHGVAPIDVVQDDLVPAVCHPVEERCRDIPVGGHAIDVLVRHRVAVQIGHRGQVPREGRRAGDDLPRVVPPHAILRPHAPRGAIEADPLAVVDLGRVVGVARRGRAPQLAPGDMRRVDVHVRRRARDQLLAIQEEPIVRVQPGGAVALGAPRDRRHPGQAPSDARHRHAAGPRRVRQPERRRQPMVRRHGKRHRRVELAGARCHDRARFRRRRAGGSTRRGGRAGQAHVVGGAPLRRHTHHRHRCHQRGAQRSSLHRSLRSSFGGGPGRTRGNARRCLALRTSPHRTTRAERRSACLHGSVASGSHASAADPWPTSGSRPPVALTRVRGCQQGGRQARSSHLAYRRFAAWSMTNRPGSVIRRRARRSRASGAAHTAAGPR